MHLKDLIEFFQKKVWLIDFRVIVCEILQVETCWEKLLSQEKKPTEILYFNWVDRTQ